jgi:hypothetical protein
MHSCKVRKKERKFGGWFSGVIYYKKIKTLRGVKNRGGQHIIHRTVVVLPEISV